MKNFDSKSLIQTTYTLVRRGGRRLVTWTSCGRLVAIRFWRGARTILRFAGGRCILWRYVRLFFAYKIEKSINEILNLPKILIFALIVVLAERIYFYQLLLKAR